MDDPGGPLPPAGARGTFGGMDPWQQTVETRLGDLRTDLRAVAADVSSLKIDMAMVKERISHLPTKGFIVSALLSNLAVIAALTTFAPSLQHFLGLR